MKPEYSPEVQEILCSAEKSATLEGVPVELRHLEGAIECLKDTKTRSFSIQGREIEGGVAFDFPFGFVLNPAENFTISLVGANFSN